MLLRNCWLLLVVSLSLLSLEQFAVLRADEKPAADKKPTEKTSAEKKEDDKKLKFELKMKQKHEAWSNKQM